MWPMWVGNTERKGKEIRAMYSDISSEPGYELMLPGKVCCNARVNQRLAVV